MALVVMSQLADLLTFPIAIAQPGRELGVAAVVLEVGGLPLVLAFKSAGLVVVAYLAWRLAHRPRLLAAIALVGFVGAASNLSTLL